jgi:hypothetical protein
MKKLVFVFTVTAFGLLSCKKEDMSKYVTKDELSKSQQDNEAKVYKFSMTFDENVNTQYSPIISTNSSEDIVLTFINWETIQNTNSWVQCPLTMEGITVLPEFFNNKLFVQILKEDGQSGSPFTDSTTLKFKAVVISAAEFKANPNFDYSDFEKVKDKFLTNK